MLTIDKEFESLCPKLTDNELAQLRENLEADGCRDPLVIWGHSGEELLVDGHNRYKLCQELGIGFKTVRMRFESRKEAKRWIICNQLGRRNLAPEKASYFRGRLYDLLKRDDGGHGDQKSEGQNVTPNAAEAVAEIAGVDPRTVKRDAEFASAVDAIGEDEPEAKAEILSGKSGLTKPQVVKAGKSKSPKAAIAAAKAENAAKKAKKKTGGRVGQIKDLIKSIVKDVDRLKKMLEEPDVFSLECYRERSLLRLSMTREGLLDIMQKTLVEN